MNHALCAVQINLVNADYTAGPGEVTQLSVASPALATTASLNANTGALSTFAGQGDAITVDKTFTLTGESQGTRIIAIPTGTQGNLTVKAVVDGATSTVPVTLNQPFVQGKAYVVNLKVKDAKTPVELISVTVKEWTEEQLGDFDSYPIKPDNKFIYKVALPTNDTEFLATFRGFTGTIDWGDGTEPTTHVNENNPEHTYTDAGTYTITMSIDNNSWIGNNGFGIYAQYITDIMYIGSDVAKNITSMASSFSNTKIKKIRKGLFDKCTNVIYFPSTFAACDELTEIPAGLFDKCTEAKSFFNTFSNCKKLKEIPVGFFSKCTKAENFGSTFRGCSSLTTIPNIFAGCTNVTTFEETFSDCTSLTSLAAGLFDSCTQLSSYRSFRLTFSNCTSLTELPVGLFNHCTKATEFWGTFERCGGLKKVPRIFDGCTGVTKFTNTFKECRGLTEITQGLFDGCPNVTDFYQTFYKCTSLISVPQIFDNCTEVTKFEYTFNGCGALKSISEKLFDACTKVTRFFWTFAGCMELTGESPYTLVNGVKVHLYERKNYTEFFATPEESNYCFGNCYDLTDFNNIPRKWR